nr:uncharacterized protein LOC113824985 [Penaeus vannamei]
MSPRRGPMLSQNRQNSQDVGGSALSGAPDPGDLSSVPSGANPSSLTPPTPARAQGGLSSSPANLEQTESDTPQPNQASSSGTVYEVWSQEIGICDLLPIPVLYPVVLGDSGAPLEVVLDPTVLRHRALRQYSFFQLHVHLKRGEDLVARDACGKLLPQYSSYQSGDSARAGYGFRGHLNITTAAPHACYLCIVYRHIEMHFYKEYKREFGWNETKCSELFCKPGSILTFAMELKHLLVVKVSYMLDFVAINCVGLFICTCRGFAPLVSESDVVRYCNGEKHVA